MVSEVPKEDAAQTSGPRAPGVPVTAEGRSEAGLVSQPSGLTLRVAALRWGVCALYVAFVTWLSLAPTTVFKPVLKLFPQADKVAHFLMYGFLVVVVRWAMTGSGVHWRPQGIWLPVLALVYGSLMELAQLLLVPADRSFEVWDMVANGVGALVFWGACNLWTSCRLRTAESKKQAAKTENRK